MDEELEKDMVNQEPYDLGEIEVVRYRAGAEYHEVEAAMAIDEGREPPPRSEDATTRVSNRKGGARGSTAIPKGAPRYPTEGHHLKGMEKALENRDDESLMHLIEKDDMAEANVYQSLKIREARSRPEYKKTVGAEIGRMVDFECWGVRLEN